MKKLILLAFFCFIPPAFSKPPKPRKNILRLKQLVVKGKRAIPQAFFVLRRAPMGYNELTSKQSFVQKVILSVKRRPF